MVGAGGVVGASLRHSRVGYLVECVTCIILDLGEVLAALMGIGRVCMGSRLFKRKEG